MRVLVVVLAACVFSVATSPADQGFGADFGCFTDDPATLRANGSEWPPECRDVAVAASPAASDTLRSRLLVLAANRDGARVELIVAGLTPELAAVADRDVAAALVTARTDAGATTRLAAPSPTETTLRWTASFVVDRSFSMRGEDFDRLSALLGGGVARAAPLFEAEVLGAGGSVVDQQAFTTDAALLSEALTFGVEDDGASALIDATGAALRHLDERAGGRGLVVVAADGPDSASRFWTAAELAADAAASEATIVVLSSVWADVDFWQEVVDARGAIVHVPSLTDADAALDAVDDVIASARAIVIDGVPADATSLELDVGGARGVVALPVAAAP